MARKSKTEILHDKVVTDLFRHPEKLGINPYELVAKAKEPEYYTHNFTGNTFVSPDLIFNLWDEVKVYEVKTSCSSNCLSKAVQQLRRTRDWYNEYSESEKPLKTFLVYPKVDRTRGLEMVLNNLKVLELKK